MAKYNTQKKPVSTAKTTNRAGGPAYKQTDTLELVSMMLTSFMKNQHYSTEDENQSRLKTLVEQSADKEFVAKAAVYARNEFGMRSVTHFVAAIIAHEVKGEQWTKKFFKQVFRRVDDITETLACYMTMYGKPLPNSLKKGARLALAKFNAYELAKYRAKDKDVKLVDVVNLVHPTPTTDNKQALKELVKGQLKNEDTWEAMLSAAGNDAEKKANVWRVLLSTNTLGYFALLRNLRNIEKQAPKMLPEALKQLVNEKAIKGSLVLPFRFFTAYNVMKNEGGNMRVLQAISRAADLSLNNVPLFVGRTCVVLDHSGSMTSSVVNGDYKRSNDHGTPIAIGSMLAAALAKSNACDVILFSETAKYVKYNPEDSVITIANQFMNGLESSGTNFDAPFEIMKKQYDRIIILSDMQGWIGYRTPAEGSFKKYCQVSGSKPMVYSFDLTGYGDMQFPQDKVCCLAGFSDKVFDLMRLLETDKHALKNTIGSIVFE